MESTGTHTLTNGAGALHPENKNARYQLLSKPAAKELRKAMNEAFSRNFNSSIDTMANALHISPNGLRKILMKTEGSISVQTKQAFEHAIGDEIHLSSPTPKSDNKELRSGLLPAAELKAFRSELANEVRDHGRTEVAVAMGMAAHSLGLILNGKGSSYRTLEKFNAYKERFTTKLETVSAYEPKLPTRTNTTLLELTSTRLDLYGLAGRLLSEGRMQHALLISLVARTCDTLPIERITTALTGLLAHAPSL